MMQRCQARAAHSVQLTCLGALLCAAVLQGRIEHETVEVPSSNPAGCPSPAPFSISSLLPWSNGGAGGGVTCSSCGDTLSSGCASTPQAGFSTCPAAADLGSGASMALPGTDAGVMTVEREVILPGCPMNGAPGRNLDNHLCIMCGEWQLFA